MATAPAVPTVLVDEYLNSSYEHDMEFVEGVLVPRGMPTIPHTLLQKILLFWFAQFEDQLGFEAMQEVRTQIVAGSRYRIPDVLLCPRPIPTGRICDVTPWAVLEVLSPDDTLSETRDRFEDYRNMGVCSMVLMDPERYIAYEFHDGSLIARPFETLQLPDSKTVPFDTNALFAQLRQKRSVR